MHYLYCDIETIGDIAMSHEEIEAFIRAKVPKTHKKPETIDRWVNVQMGMADNAWTKTALDKLKCRVYCIAWAINDEPVQVLYETYRLFKVNEGDFWRTSTVDEHEQSLLLSFDHALREALDGDHAPVRWVAHGGVGFDFPILRLRAMKYRLPALLQSLPSDKWGKDCDDTMTMVGGRDWVKLDALAKFFGLAGKTEGMDGSKVYPAFCRGEHEKNAGYCGQDVEVLRGAHRRLRGL